MSITAGELIWRAPANSSDAGTNGGRMTPTPITSNIKNNIWPDVLQAERVAGSTKYRKVFIHVANDDDLALIQARVFVETNTPGDDSVTIFPGTQTDTQSGLTGTERQYGCGKLNADVSIGASTITVLTEGAALNYFRAGDKVRISDKATIDAVSGNTQVVTITGAAPTYVGAVVTFAIVETLSYAFAAASTRVASIIQAGNVAGSVASIVKTSVGGTYNSGTYPPVVYSIGGIEQNWTLTFTSPTAFNCVGDTVGAAGSGNVSSGFSPVNAGFSKPYFTIPAAAWGGSFLAGDTLTFTTHPASIPVWYKRIIPPGAASLTGNKAIIGIDGESA